MEEQFNIMNIECEVCKVIIKLCSITNERRNTQE